MLNTPYFYPDEKAYHFNFGVNVGMCNGDHLFTTLLEFSEL